MAGIEIRGRDATDAARGWWLFAVIGTASLIAGVIIVLKPSQSLATLAVVTGIFLLLDGLVELVESLGHSVENRGLAAIIGVLGIVAGVLLIRHPTHAVTAIGLLIGICLIAAGILRLLRAVALGALRLWGLVIALLEIAVGIAIVSQPHIGYATLAILLGIWLIINGVAMIVLGLAIRHVPSEFAAERPQSAPAR